MTSTGADFGVWTAIFAAGLLVVAFVSGWAVAGQSSSRSLEQRSLAADVIWLTAALSDSEQRAAMQANWIADMARELAELRSRGGSNVLRIDHARTQPPHRPSGLKDAVG